MLNSTATIFFLNYSFRFNYICSVEDVKDGGLYSGHDAYYSVGFVSFRVDDDGLDPSAALADDRCATGP
ncbi:hypothetical protein IMZ48_37925 [Candidatus Bathyarchaeota archaeon]|nr:hypothetical protein [Candidatus Bathyarchaeota archaeon]